MSRRHGRKPEIPSLGAQFELPAQQVWDAGRVELNSAMVILLRQEAALREGKKLIEDEQVELLNHLTNAMYSFEILVERDANPKIVKPLAEGCRRLGEGLLNGDTDEVLEGRRLIVNTMVPIEEEAERQ